MSRQAKENDGPPLLPSLVSSLTLTFNFTPPSEPSLEGEGMMDLAFDGEGGEMA
jgi:hypothetical protein